MKFKELAWGAFVFANISRRDYFYSKLGSDKEFLTRLQRKPTAEDFERLRWFLVHYGVHTTPKTYADQLISLWPRLKPRVKAIMGERLETCDLGSDEICAVITGLYDCLRYGAWGGDTVISKVIHFLNVSLFPMWDTDISIEYSSGVIGSSAYLQFMKAMQQHATEVIEDFHRLGLPGQPDQFLSQKLGYPYIRPLTKLIDDFNWVTITRGWPSNIPDWLLELHRQT